LSSTEVTPKSAFLPPSLPKITHAFALPFWICSGVEPLFPEVS